MKRDTGHPSMGTGWCRCRMRRCTERRCTYPSTSDTFHLDTKRKQPLRFILSSPPPHPLSFSLSLSLSLLTPFPSTTYHHWGGNWTAIVRTTPDRTGAIGTGGQCEGAFEGILGAALVSSHAHSRWTSE